LLIARSIIQLFSMVGGTHCFLPDSSKARFADLDGISLNLSLLAVT
jgi:hypothetical protein